MSAVPSIGPYTSQDIDLRLKESEKLLNEWAKLLEKAGMIQGQAIIFYYLSDNSVHFIHSQKKLPTPAKFRKLMLSNISDWYGEVVSCNRFCLT